MHWGNLWRYIFPATRGSCFVLRRTASFTFRLLGFAQLVDEASKESQSAEYISVSFVFEINHDHFNRDLIKGLEGYFEMNLYQPNVRLLLC